MSKRWLTILAALGATAVCGVASAEDPPSAARAARAASPEVQQAEPAVKAPPEVRQAEPTVKSSPAAAKPRKASAKADAAPGEKSAKAIDRLELETTQITGNRELPKVMVIVPWKRSDIGDLVGRPVNSLVDEALQPVDREVFRREIDYFDALAPDRARSETRVTGGTAGSRPEK
jgi:hypothetical protein